jgi:hypothetical protein
MLTNGKEIVVDSLVRITAMYVSGDVKGLARLLVEYAAKIYLSSGLSAAVARGMQGWPFATLTAALTYVGVGGAAVAESMQRYPFIYDTTWPGYAIVNATTTAGREQLRFGPHAPLFDATHAAFVPRRATETFALDDIQQADDFSWDSIRRTNGTRVAIASFDTYVKVGSNLSIIGLNHTHVTLDEISISAGGSTSAEGNTAKLVDYVLGKRAISLALRPVFPKYDRCLIGHDWSWVMSYFPPALVFPTATEREADQMCVLTWHPNALARWAVIETYRVVMIMAPTFSFVEMGIKTEA